MRSPFPVVLPCRPREQRRLALSRPSRWLAALLMLFTSSRPLAARQVPFTALSVPPTTSAWGVAAGDLDDDGRPDLVFSDDVGDTVLWLRRLSGPQILEPVATGVDGAAGVAVADFDGDGDDDVAVAARDADQVLVYLHGGGASWSGPVTVASSATGVTDLVAGDLDGDGDVDLAAALTATGVVRRWLNGGDGSTWQAGPVAPTAAGVSDLAIADVDGDGDLDLVGAVTGADRVRWWANDGAGGGWAATPIDLAAPGPVAVTVGDLDGDGDLDVAGALAGSDEVVWWENALGDGSSWSGPYVVGSRSALTAVAAADLDGDGDVDLAVTTGTTGATIGWFERTSPSAWLWRTIDPSGTRTPRQLLAVDLDADGDADLAYPSGGPAGGEWVAQNVDPHRRARFPFSSAFDAGFLRDGAIRRWATGDVDGDGRADVVLNDILVGQPDALLLVRAQPPSGPDVLTYTRTTIATADLYLQNLALADLDGDGDLDVLSGPDDVVHELDVYENEGHATSWAVHAAIHQVGQPPFQVIASGDLDGDGDLDIVGFLEQLSPLERVLAWWEQVGDPFTAAGWARHDLVTNQSDPLLLIDDLQLGDVDGDGDLDLVSGYDSTKPLVFWENTGGSPLTVVRHDLAAFGSTRVALADLDLDGDLDVVGALGWWQNELRTGGGWVQRSVPRLFPAALADLDHDGDLDVIGGTCDAGGGQTATCWWQNDTRIGPGDLTASWLPPQYVSESWFAAGDFDGDGDGDVIGGPSSGGVASWRNQAAQATLTAELQPDGTLVAGTTTSLLTLDFEHGGTLGDGTLELSTIALDVTADGAPVDAATMSGLVGAFDLWRDDGDGVRDGGDTLASHVAAFSVVAGRVTLPLADGDLGLADGADLAPFYGPVRFFVEAEVAPGAATLGVDRLTLAFDPAAGSVVEVRDFDTPVTVERQLVLRRSFDVTATAPPLAFADGFESGGFDAWWAFTP